MLWKVVVCGWLSRNRGCSHSIQRSDQLIHLNGSKYSVRSLWCDVGERRFIEPRRFRMPPGDHVGFGRCYVVAACRVRDRHRRRGDADHRRDEDGDHHEGCLPAAKASVQHERMKPGYE